MSTPTPIIPNNDEKHQRLGEKDLETDFDIGTTNDRQDSGSEDGKSTVQGDDALRLVGAHAHKFDEKYYRRLRWKIVCIPSVQSLAMSDADVRQGPPRDASSGLHILHAVPGQEHFVRQTEG